MRTFIAIDIDKKIKQTVEDLQQRLEREGNFARSDIKWVRPEAMHLTLKFLGEIKREKSVEICKIVQEVTGRHRSFELSVESVGFFGGKAAKVLWIGIAEGSDKLNLLAEDIAQQLALAGWAKENRKFAGHLTICRIKNTKAGIKVAQLSQEYEDFRAGVSMAEAVSVYESQLTPQGAVYTLLGKYNLQ